jgi:hypothetical protein
VSGTKIKPDRQNLGMITLRFLHHPASQDKAMQNNPILIALSAGLLLAGCASDGNTRLSIGLGSFGSSGGVSGSVSTDVSGMGGQDDEPPLPIVQVWLADGVIAAVFPDKQIPFTADKDEAKALSEYIDAGSKPGVSAEAQEQVASCVSEAALCRVRLQEI